MHHASRLLGVRMAPGEDGGASLESSEEESRSEGLGTESESETTDDSIDEEGPESLTLQDKIDDALISKNIGSIKEVLAEAH